MLYTYKSHGIVEYGPKIRAVLRVDQNIADYYRALVPKWYTINRQKHPAHISFVRKETPPNMIPWGKYSGLIIEYEYYPDIYWDDKYFWIKIKCDRLAEIREELGLKPFPWWENKFHITIGNRKS